ncbi:restriction endonuclease subunit S [Enterobacter hormaechei]|nr:restriction endonuclease subunit S [Enterobacter hormaechei]MDV5849091.1 restriction endonuclease subunit S [Enterobacter hormaechei]
MVPKGWASLQLGKIMSFKNGLNFTKTDNGDSVKIVGVGDFKDFTELTSTEHLELISVAGRIRDEELLNNGDLLFVRSNGNKDLIGRCMFFPEVRERLSFSGFTIRGRVINEGALPAYMAIVARSSQFQTQISKASGGTNISNLSQQILNDINLLLPPLIEQKKIAQILSTWDKAISVTEKLLTNSQQQKKALMQQLLTGEKRLLDENGVRFSGKWKWLRAAELFKTISQKNNSEDEELLAVTQDLGVIPRSMLERRVVMPDGTTKGYKLVVSGNFIISLRSFQGGLEYSRYRGLVSPAYTVLTPIKKIVDEFYMQYYKSYNFIGHLAVAVIGIRDGKQISYEDFSFLKLPYPEIEEQQKIATVLSAADDEIATLEKKLACLKEEKKALMQQLLTGKRRVKVDEAVAA